jgi:DNA segregation ATPase FtsK/SpoIIIE, S-DNA-T family
MDMMDFENFDARNQIKAIKEKARRRNSRIKRNHIVFWSFLGFINLFLSGFNLNKFFTYLLIQLFTFIGIALLLFISGSKNKARKNKKHRRPLTHFAEKDSNYQYTEEDYFKELEYANAFPKSMSSEVEDQYSPRDSNSGFYNHESMNEHSNAKKLDWLIEDQPKVQSESQESSKMHAMQENKNTKTEPESFKKFQGGIRYVSPYRPVNQSKEIEKHQNILSVTAIDTQKEPSKEINRIEDSSQSFSFVPSSIRSLSIPELEIKGAGDSTSFPNAAMDLQEFSLSVKKNDILIEEILSSLRGGSTKLEENFTKGSYGGIEELILQKNKNFGIEKQEDFTKANSEKIQPKMESTQEEVPQSSQNNEILTTEEEQVLNQEKQTHVDVQSMNMEKKELCEEENNESAEKNKHDKLLESNSDMKMEDETTIINYSKVISLLEHVNKKKDPSEEDDKLEADDLIENTKVDQNDDLNFTLNIHEENLEKEIDLENKEDSPPSPPLMDPSVVFEFDHENSLMLKPNISPKWGISPGHWTKVVSEWKKFQIPQNNDKVLMKSELMPESFEKEVAEEKKEQPKITGPKSYVQNDYVYNPPQLDMLYDNPDKNVKTITEDGTLMKAEKLVDTLESFGVGTKIVNISKGPSITRFELQPDKGVKVSRVVNLSDDIALNLEAASVRIEAPIPGKAAIGIEIPNKKITSVYLKEVIASPEFSSHPAKLAFAVGKDTAGNMVVTDIAQMPHLLIAGATGSGKSVCINTLIASILYRADPSQVKFIMIDPKVVELNVYNGIPHLLSPVVTDPKKASVVLNWAVGEMNNRYKLFAEHGVRDLFSYNKFLSENGDENTLPQIVIIIDELADLMLVAPKEIEDTICRLAQMARAAGMHIVIATQRPSVDVITGVIKANIPSRISFAVSSQVDSRTILDMAGAEKLVGKGDMLFSPIGVQKPLRVQGCFITDREVESIVSAVKFNASQKFDQDLLDQIQFQKEEAHSENNNEDELFPEVVETVLDLGQASTSMIQRKLRIGYARAARLMDQLEAWGIVSPADGSKPRNILISKEEWKELNK